MADIKTLRKYLISTNPTGNMHEEIGRVYDAELYWNIILLQLSGIWPKDRSWGRTKSILYETWAIVQMTGLIVITALEYFSIRDAWGSVYEVTKIFSATTSSLIIIQKGLHFMWNREILTEIYFSVREMWISTSIESASSDPQKLLRKTARFYKYIFMLYAIAPTITLICFSLSPIQYLAEQRATNVSEKDINYTFPYGAQFPWINISDSLNYSLCYFASSGVSVAVLLYEMSVDSFYMLYISQICEQFKLLDRKLKELDFFDSFDENINRRSILRNCIEKHLKLIRMCEAMKKLYSPIILIFCACMTLSLCTVIFQIVIMNTKSNPVLYTSYLIFECSEIFMFCWFGQQMTDQARFISDAVYHSQWYDASQQEKQSLRMIMGRAQKPLYITASGFAVVSLELCTTIFGTSLSYFTLLRKVYYR